MFWLNSVDVFLNWQLFRLILLTCNKFESEARDFLETVVDFCFSKSIYFLEES